MKTFLIRLIRLLWGLFLFALGIVITMRANMGFAPWEVFHAGTGKALHLTIGNMSIITGLVVCVIVLMMGERLGLGTILNMLLIGIFIDWISALGVIPKMEGPWLKLPMFVVGIIIIAFASYFYMSSGFGAGPRDSLMVALTRKTGLPIGICRGTIELFAVITGGMLGGMVGFGTVFFVLAVGYFVQFVFKMMHFDATKVKHQTLKDTWSELAEEVW